jgi:energy-coupling factor transporter transmembrane protein EcfT
MHNCMDIQQIAPWVSLVASLCSLVYVGIQIRHPSGDDSETDRERRGFGDVVAQSQIFLVIAASMLLFAGAVHYVLWLFSVPAFAGPVWMVAAFVIVFMAVIETTPGDTFEERVENFTESATPSDATVETGEDPGVVENNSDE